MTGPGVHVVLPIGEWSSPRCTIDELTPGELTVSSLDSDYIVRVFPAGCWQSATVYDGQGYPLICFLANDDEDEATVRALEAEYPEFRTKLVTR